MINIEIGSIHKLFEKGFGFITKEEGADIFFHANNIADGTEFQDLRVGQRVEFSIAETPKGPAAVDIVLAGSKR